ncbi:MAG: hypothetical protein F4015_03600 [Acidimicrobiia bacterium]|nr:hypothetical protein [Acidimicrobiia bacterium]
MASLPSNGHDAGIAVCSGCGITEAEAETSASVKWAHRHRYRERLPVCEGAKAARHRYNIQWRAAADEKTKEALRDWEIARGAQFALPLLPPGWEAPRLDPPPVVEATELEPPALDPLLVAVLDEARRHGSGWEREKWELWKRLFDLSLDYVLRWQTAEAPAGAKR